MKTFAINFHRSSVNDQIKPFCYGFEKIVDMWPFMNKK